MGSPAAGCCSTRAKRRAPLGSGFARLRADFFWFAKQKWPYFTGKASAAISGAHGLGGCLGCPMYFYTSMFGMRRKTRCFFASGSSTRRTDRELKPATRPGPGRHIRVFWARRRRAAVARARSASAGAPLGGGFARLRADLFWFAKQKWPYCTGKASAAISGAHGLGGSVQGLRHIKICPVA